MVTDAKTVLLSGLPSPLFHRGRIPVQAGTPPPPSERVRDDRRAAPAAAGLQFTTTPGVNQVARPLPRRTYGLMKRSSPAIIGLSGVADRVILSGYRCII